MDQEEIVKSFHLQDITHPTEINIGEKFSYLANCINMTSTKIGEHYFFELGTHQYFIDLLIYRCENPGNQCANIVKQTKFFLK